MDLDWGCIRKSESVRSGRGRFPGMPPCLRAVFARVFLEENRGRGHQGLGHRLSRHDCGSALMVVIVGAACERTECAI